ncbi:MAG: hypothetical protein E7494_03325 [Ruminococcus albus]|nr:hypothetical protein [Ruminococcus albus]
MKKIFPLILALALAGCAGASNNDNKAESKAETSAVNDTAEQVSSDVSPDIPDSMTEISDEKLSTGIISHVQYSSLIMKYDYMVDSTEEYKIFKSFCGDVPEFDDIDFDKYTLFAKTGAGSSGDKYVIDRVLISGTKVMLNITKTEDGMTDDNVKRWFYAVIPKADLPDEIKDWKRPSESKMASAGISLVNACIEPNSFNTAKYEAILKKYDAFQASIRYMGSNGMILLRFLTVKSDADGINQDIESSFVPQLSEKGENKITVTKTDLPTSVYKEQNSNSPDSYDTGSILVRIQCTEPSSQYNEAADYIEEAFGETDWISSPKDNCIEGRLELDNFPVEKLQSSIEAINDVNEKFDIKLNGFSLTYKYN